MNTEMVRRIPANVEGIRRRWELNEPVTTKEAAQLLGLSYQTVYRRLAETQPFGIAARQHYYTPAQVRAACFGGVQ